MTINPEDYIQLLARLTDAQEAILRGPRVEGFRVDLLTYRDVFVRTLDGVLGGDVTQDVSGVIVGGGTLTMEALPSQRIDWLTQRVQIWWTVGDTLAWPLGVFLLSAPTADYGEDGQTWNVELLDKLAVLDQDKIEQAYSLAAGTLPTAIIPVLIQSTGEGKISITDSTETLTDGMLWPAGTSKLEVINDLLAAINYFPLRCDGNGQFFSAPYTGVRERASNWDFLEGELAIHQPAFSRDQDLVSVPNRVMLTAQTSGKTEALTSTAENLDPTSPLSYPSRGRWITYVETGVEATSQAVLNGLAARKLQEQSSAVSSLRVAHAALPLEVNDAVTFDTSGVEAVGAVVRTQLALEVGAQMQTTIQEAP